MSNYGGFSCSKFSIFSPNTVKYGPEKTPYLHTFNTALNYHEGAIAQS